MTRQQLSWYNIFHNPLPIRYVRINSNLIMTIKQTFTLPILAVILLCFSIAACEKDEENFPIGEDWINLNTNVYYIDTLTLNTSTFKFDSIVVSGTDRLLVGAYTDPVFGTVKSKSYVQLDNAEYSLDSDAVYDSIALILKYDDYFYNDTIPEQTFNIYKVTEDIEYQEDAESYYNTSTFKIDSTVLGSKTFIAKPNKEDSLHIRMSDAFGKELFDQILNNTINNADDFQQVYKGILIDANANNTTMLGFLKSSVVRVYYKVDEEVDGDDSSFDLTFNSTNSFHNVSSDKSGTAFESLTNQTTYIESSETNHFTYMQGGTGLATRIDIPNLETLYDIPGTGAIADASLSLSIKQNSNTKNLYTTDSLSIYIIDKKANLISALTDSEGSTVLGTIVEEDTEFNITTYSIPIKYFLNLKLTSANKDNLFLAVFPKGFTQSVNRYVFYGNDSSDNLKSKLKITYASYDE